MQNNPAHELAVELRYLNMDIVNITTAKIENLKAIKPEALRLYHMICTSARAYQKESRLLNFLW